MDFIHGKILSKQIIATMVCSATLTAFAQTQPSGGTQVAQVTMSLSQPTGSVSTEIDQTKSATDKKFSLGLGLEYSQKIADDEQGSRETDLGATLIPVYKINQTFAVGAKAIVSKENYGARNTKLANTTVSLTIDGYQLNSNFKTLHTVGGALPTSEESRVRDRYFGGVSISNGIAFTTDLLQLKYLLALSRNFHEFTFNSEETSNIQYRLGHSIEGILMITDSINLSGLGVYRVGRSYGGFERNSFEFHGDVNFDVAEGLTLNVGTSNEGSALKSNGVDSNLSAYDDDSSVVRAGVAYAY